MQEAIQNEASLSLADCYFRNVPAGIVFLDKNLRILELNDEARRLLRVEGSVGVHTFVDHITSETLQRIERELIPIAQKHGSWVGSLLVTHLAATHISCAAIFQAYQTEAHGDFFSITLRPYRDNDSDELPQAIRRGFVDSVLESIDDAVFIVESRTRQITFCNLAATRMLGYPKSELLGRTTEFIHVDKWHFEEFDRLSGGRLRDTGRFDCEFRLRRKDGTVLDTSHHVVIIGQDGDMPAEAVSIVRDISAEKRAMRERILYQKQLRDLTNRLDLMQADSRREVAEYLHDEVIQSLSLALMNVDALDVDGPPYSQSHLKSLEKTLTDSVSAIRKTINDLSPPGLKELGLLAALESLCSSLDGQYAETRVHFSPGGAFSRVSRMQELILFTAARETLLNALRHANANEVIMVADADARDIKIEVRDDGDGFELELATSSSGSGFGIFHISERLRSIGGSLEIESTPGEGTRMLISIPNNTASKAQK